MTRAGQNAITNLPDFAKGGTLPHRLQLLGTAPISLWRGNPDCDAMHTFVLDALNEIGCSFMGSGVDLIQNQVGNLGEFVVMCVGRKKVFADYCCQPANAHEPLSTISKAGLDLIWFRFAVDPSQDSVLVQEVKTTGNPGLTILSSLVEDHRKMFVRPSRKTLLVMLQGIKSRLVFEEGRPDLAARVTRMCGATPQTCDGVRLHPTILHEKAGSNPEQVMLAVRSSIAALGDRHRTVVGSDGWP